MVSPPEEGGFKYSRPEENNIIIRNYTLSNIIPHQLKNMYAWYKVICVCKCLISAKIINSYLLL